VISKNQQVNFGGFQIEKSADFDKGAAYFLKIG
jgi:hypothetical protein